VDASVRSTVDVVAEELGPSLRWATATMSRATKSDGSWSSVAEVVRRFRSLVGSGSGAGLQGSVGPGSWPCLTVSWPRGAVRGVSQPQRGLGWLHGLGNDRQHLSGEAIEVDLVA
jgi:hypothetical protein